MAYIQPGNTPLHKAKGGGTRKVCLPAAKVRSMSAAEKKKVINAKKSAASQGKRVRSSKSNVKGARKKGATLRDWFEKENWINVETGEPCGKQNKMNIADIRLYAMNAGTLSVTTFTQIEDSLKILLLIVTIGYTVSKWIHIKRNND